MKEILKSDTVIVKQLCNEILGEEYSEIERMGGLTNHTYRVKMQQGKNYAIRVPGEGTEKLIVRANERISTELACELGIDAQCLYFGEDGKKITEYIYEAETMSPITLKSSKSIEQMAEVFIRLHTCGKDTGVPFEVFDMAVGYEKIIEDNRVSLYQDYNFIKMEVMEIKEVIDKLGMVKKVPCHNDPLCENWVRDGHGKMYLIDWEYGGMNDGMWDLADVSIEAGYGVEEETKLLETYLKRSVEKDDWRHFFANKIYVDYLWTLWAKARVPFDGQAMEEWALERYTRLKRNISKFNNVL